jgi:PhzF family phenazine biosynthesis protein
MKIPVFQIDAFTDVSFSGNPAAVCPLDEWLPDHVMQSIALEMNLSETAFLVPSSLNLDEFDLRWFSPTTEVDLCGHATLASGHVVFTKLRSDLNQVTFHTRSGALHVERRSDLLEMDFPANPPSILVDTNERAAVASALGATPTEILHANTTIAVFETEAEVAALQPDFIAVARLKEPWLAATAPSSSVEYDFVSRFFVPTAGIDEDSATGSSHTILIPYWAKRFGKNKLVGSQISKRGGTMYCELSEHRVKIGGSVVEVMVGELTI